MTALPRRSDPLTAVHWLRSSGALFVLLALAKISLLAPFLLYRRLEWSYPFLGGDGGEWLSQGLALSGAAVRSTGRQPLLPLLIGLVDRAGALRFLPWLPLAMAAALELLLFYWMRRLHGSAVAWAGGLFVVTHHALLEQSVQLMADLLATALLTAAALALLELGSARWRWSLVTLLGAAAVLAQQVSLVPLTVLLAMGAARSWRAAEGRPRGREVRYAALALAGIALPNLAWQLWLHRGGGGGLLVLAAQRDYLRPHLAGLDDLGALSFAFFGLPALGLVLWEVAVLARRSSPAEGRLAAWVPSSLAWMAATGLFLAVLYDYRASRFLLYLLPPFVLLMARRLAALRSRPPLFAGAVLTAILGGAWTQAAGEARTGLWPLPPVELVAGVEGEDDPPLRPRLERTSYAELLRRSLPWRAVRLWRERGAERPPVVPALPALRVVVALYGEGTPVEGRYDLRNRIGLTLRRRTKLAPCSLFPPRWRGWGELREVERSGELRFLRGFERGLPSPWLLVAPVACLPSRVAVPSAGARIAWTEPALIAAIERRLPGADDFVAVVPEGEGGRTLARALALSLRTTNFFLLDRGTAEALPRSDAAEEMVGPFRLRRVRYRRWPVLLLEPVAGSRTIRSKISSRASAGSAQRPL